MATRWWKKLWRCWRFWRFVLTECTNVTHTHTHLYAPTIHCGESALWGKSVRLSWSLWGKYTHTYKWYIVGKVHCGENLCVVVAIVRKSSFPHNANFIFPQCNVLMCVTHYSERRVLTAIRRPAYWYTDQWRTCPRITHAHTIYRPCT